MNIDVAHTISTIVESQLPRGGSKVISLGFDYRISRWNEEEEDYEYLWTGSIYFLFRRGCNYMKVCAWIDSDHALALDKPSSFEKKVWTLQSYHDSCWRTDGFAIFGEIYRKVAKEHHDPDLKEHLHLDSFNILKSDQVSNARYRNYDGEIRNFVDDHVERDI